MTIDLQQIYAIFVPAGVYIGRTKNVINRMQSHRMLYCDWVVLETATSDTIRDREAYWIKYFVDLGARVLNLMKNTNNHGLFEHSKESIEKMRLAAVESNQNFRRGVAVNCSIEMRQLAANSNTGKKRSPETREKIRQAMIGKKRPETSALWRQHISEARQGKKYGPQVRWEQFT
jgi:NUMOD3 motif